MFLYGVYGKTTTPRNPTPELSLRRCYGEYAPSRILSLYVVSDVVLYCRGAWLLLLGLPFTFPLTCSVDYLLRGSVILGQPQRTLCAEASLSSRVLPFGVSEDRVEYN